MIIKGRVIDVAQNNLTICPRAKKQWIRCSYIALANKQVIEGPLQMSEQVYQALQSGQSVEFHLGHRHTRKAVTRVRLEDGTTVGRHNFLSARLALSVLTVSLFYSVIRGILLHLG
ncbi:hypothetical protein EV690_3371 [Celerinatantimonas diazotrophica]|uniref:Uncharacterized protein n=2 Tax=Celerinatantimonas diazotrophica TaxID=412034 RepID=A0A4R1J886_9GAMM|nr:hypothetical protein EV690_3371 [Celerinatantimonas diazotrophica]CAG9295486.1 hypothetical protein CEDIAZO_00602 [Celerinatantimonas diazotrophica]